MKLVKMVGRIHEKDGWLVVERCCCRRKTTMVKDPPVSAIAIDILAMRPWDMQFWQGGEGMISDVFEAS